MNSCAQRQSKQELTNGRDWWIATGIFFVVLGVYILSSPGRIDIIDGQARFDVTFNWLRTGRPFLGDPWIRSWMGVVGRGGFIYSYYGAPASVFSMPLVWIGGVGDVRALEPSRFLFSLTSPIFGAGIAFVLFFFFIKLGLSRRKALLWTLVSALTTLLWPTSASTFDNAQHAFFALSAVYVGFLSTMRNSRILACLGGLLAAVLIMYQEYFLLIVPALALSTFKIIPEQPKQADRWADQCPAGDIPRPSRTCIQVLKAAVLHRGEDRESCLRFLLWTSTAILVGLVLSFAYNHFRFGSYLDDGKFRFQVQRVYPLWGNPIAGFLTLVFSPGKSIFLYSPPIVLGMLGYRSLRRRWPQIAAATGAASILLVLFLSCIAFAGGDWCWGPRYLAVLLPLWSVACPFVTINSTFRRECCLAIIALGLLVQVLALSVEHQRFFFEKGFNDFFWAEDPWVYFKHSALFSRVGETLSLSDGPPPTARLFNSILVPDWCTYTVLGPPPELPRRFAPEWIRYFKIFYVPRPWPLWMPWIQPGLRPINLQVWLYSLLGMVLSGIAFITRGFSFNDQKPSRDIERESGLLATICASGDSV